MWWQLLQITANNINKIIIKPLSQGWADDLTTILAITASLINGLLLDPRAEQSRAVPCRWTPGCSSSFWHSGPYITWISPARLVLRPTSVCEWTSFPSLACLGCLLGGCLTLMETQIVYCKCHMTKDQPNCPRGPPCPNYVFPASLSVGDVLLWKRAKT